MKALSKELDAWELLTEVSEDTKQFIWQAKVADIGTKIRKGELSVTQVPELLTEKKLNEGQVKAFMHDLQAWSDAEEERELVEGIKKAEAVIKDNTKALAELKEKIRSR